MKKMYAFTVKSNEKDVWPMSSDYVDWILNARQKGFNTQVFFYEIDSKDRLHIHGIAEYDLTKPLYKKSLLFRNFHQRIDELPSYLDMRRYYDYITKEYNNDYEQNALILAYEIRHGEYPFQNAESEQRSEARLS